MYGCHINDRIIIMSLKSVLEFTSIEGIDKLLREDRCTYVVIAITLETTSQPYKVFIRKWLKKKNKLFPNVLFAYYCAKENDLESDRNNLVVSNPDHYPLLYYMVDITVIGAQAVNITEQTMHDSFKYMEPWFLEDYENWKDGKPRPKKEIEKQIEEVTENNPQEDSDNETAETKLLKKKEILKKEEEIKKKNLITQEKLKYEKEMENKKMDEKINMLTDYSKKFGKEFFTDVANRKIDENGHDTEDTEKSTVDSDSTENDSDNDSDSDSS